MYAAVDVNGRESVKMKELKNNVHLYQQSPKPDDIKYLKQQSTTGHAKSLI